ncbi:MAG: hypothetical protein ACOC2E_01550, partial [Bacteroidota bacterium]
PTHIQARWEVLRRKRVFIHELCAMQRKPTAHSGTFGLADTQSQRKKPKELEVLPALAVNK